MSETLVSSLPLCLGTAATCKWLNFIPLLVWMIAVFIVILHFLDRGVIHNGNANSVANFYALGIALWMAIGIVLSL